MCVLAFEGALQVHVSLCGVTLQATWVTRDLLACVCVCDGAELQATNRDPRWWIGGQPPDMVASCDISRCFRLTNKQSRTSSGRVIRAWRW